MGEHDSRGLTGDSSASTNRDSSDGKRQESRGPTFMDLDVARSAALRELDAFVALAEALGEDDWSRATPCPGWSIRDVVEHVAGVPGYDYFAGRLRGARLGDGSGPKTNTSTSPTGLSPSELVGVLRRRADEFRAELEVLTESDLDRELFVMPGRTQLLRSALGQYVFEFGLHRYDLESALGNPIELAPDVCAGVVLMTETDGFRPYRQDLTPWGGASPAPDEDASYALVGETIQWAFSFTAGAAPPPHAPTLNGRWSSGVIHEHACTVNGTDSAICLVLCGRISTHDQLVTASAGFIPRFFTIW